MLNYSFLWKHHFQSLDYTDELMLAILWHVVDWK